MPSIMPSANRSAPAHAIIAPLSVHSAGGGMISVVCACAATACNAPRMAWLAAAPAGGPQHCAADGLVGGDTAGCHQRAGRAKTLLKQFQPDAETVRGRFQYRGLK